MAWGMSASLRSDASSTKRTPSAKARRNPTAASAARRVFPIPPGPAIVTSRYCPSAARRFSRSFPRPTKLVENRGIFEVTGGRGRLPGVGGEAVGWCLTRRTVRARVFRDPLHCNARCKRATVMSGCSSRRASIAGTRTSADEPLHGRWSSGGLSKASARRTVLRCEMFNRAAMPDIVSPASLRSAI